MLLILQQLDIWNILQLAGFALGLIILLLLIKVSSGLKRYIPLIVFVGITILQLLLDFMIDTKQIKYFPHLLYILEPFNMIWGALLYLYARNMEAQRFRLCKLDLLLLIPFLLSLLTYMPYYFTSGAEKLKDFVVYGELKTDVVDSVWEWIFEVSVNTGFLWFALRQLAKYNGKIKEQFSDIQQLDLHLTQVMIKVFMGIYLVELLFVFMTFYGFPYYEPLFYTLELLGGGFLLLIAYDAIISNKYIVEIQKGWVTVPVSEVEIDGQIVKYAKSTLTDEMSDQIKTDLVNYMNEEKPYLQTQIRIKDLSEKTGIPSHQISQVINESFQQNFYEFVNSYRVKEAMKLLKDSNFKNYTYTAIGFEVGFNSKSAFYNAFKKVTGTTPAKY